jgi:gliding motility-associated-like protein/uncharacterized repeat protein (TIGR01451 family)
MSRNTTYLLFLLLLLSLPLAAQLMEPFSVRYSESLKGNFTIIANNMLSRTSTGDYNGDNNNHDFNNNVYVDIDTDPSTFNSSSANFVNPDPSVSCISIFKAFIYWAAADTELSNGDDNQPGWNFNDIKLMLPGEVVYTTITADDVIFRGRDTHFEDDPYICVKDITTQVTALADKYGTYQVANVEAAELELSHSNVGTSGGWQIVFVYESPELPSRNITLFDGYAHVSSTANNFDILFDGFQTTPIGNVNANIVIGALEGDRHVTDDRLQILDVANNFVDITAPLRAADNFFNSRITVGNGNFIDRNPASTNTLGYDAAEFELDNPGNSIITNNQTSATLRLTSAWDAYGLYLLGLAVEVAQPNLDPMIITQTSGTNPSDPGDIIGFNVFIENTGSDDALDVEIVTTIPPQATLVPIATLPAGITYTYNATTGLLVFSVDDGLLDIGDPPIEIDFELEINDECYFLEEDCDLNFDLQFTATYVGAQNPDQVITISSSDPASCEPVPYAVIINQPIVNWLTGAGDLDVTLSCEDTVGLATAQTLEPEPDKCVFTIIKTPGPFVVGSCPNEGTYTNTWNFTDACGVTIADYVQTITITDNVLPTASNPATINVQCIDDVPVPDVSVVTDEADNCSVPIVAFVSDVSDNQSCPETITRTYSVTDACGNSINVSHSIVVNDDILPTASDPAAIQVQCIDDVPVPDVSVVTDEADNCSVPIVAFVSDVSDNQSCPETITRTYSITDVCGNSITVEQSIIVNDDILPTASNPATINVQCIDDVPAADVSVVTDEADNCSVPTVAFVSDVSDNQTCPETITRTYSVTDVCGNSISVSQSIIVNDDILPTASNPETINVQCIVDIPVPDILVVTDEADNCSAPTVTFVSDVSDNQSCPETITRTYSVTDACGNSITVIQNIIVNDEVAPVLISEIEAEINVSCEDIPDIPSVMFSDNCTVDVIVTYNEEIITIDEFSYDILRTWVAMDDCNNQTVISQTLFVRQSGEFDNAATILCINDDPIDLFSFISNTNELSGDWQGDHLELLDGSVFNPINAEVDSYEFVYTYSENNCEWKTNIIIAVNDSCLDKNCISSYDDVKISKLVTPNNDGFNDFFEVSYTLNDGNTGDCDISVDVKMYNRWGVKIFEMENYQNDWNGISPTGSIGGSGLLPSGTYYYIITLVNSGLKPKEGYILLGTD